MNPFDSVESAEVRAVPAGAAMGATSRQAFSVRAVRSFAHAEPYREAWNQVVTESGADIYQTFDWCRIWWQFYGDGRDLHLLLVFAGDRLVGIVPAFVEVVWLGLVHVRVARLLGADYSLTLCNLPVLPDSLPTAVRHAIRYFLGEQRCDTLLLGPLSGPAARIDEIASTAREAAPCVASVGVLGESCNTYFPLPASFDDYLQSIGKQQRGNFNRPLAQLSKAYSVSREVVSDAAQVTSEFEAFRLRHDAQWRAEGKLGHFGDWPRADEFNRKLVATLGPLGQVRFFNIRANDEIVSSQFCFQFGANNYWRLPARSFGTEWDRYSFGRLGLGNMIGASIAEGVRTVEGGRGHYDYKVQMGGKEWPLRTVQVIRRGLTVAPRLRLFNLTAAALNVGYYKIVFCRLAPKYPALQRPLWPGWIRTSW